MLFLINKIVLIKTVFCGDKMAMNVCPWSIKSTSKYLSLWGDSKISLHLGPQTKWYAQNYIPVVFVVHFLYIYNE